MTARRADEIPVSGMAAPGLHALAMVIVPITFHLAPSSATPYVPTDDSVVLERLPERGEPTLRELKRMRKALANGPSNIEGAVAVARRAIDASRATGDPRFLGQAQAALSP